MTLKTVLYSGTVNDRSNGKVDRVPDTELFSSNTNAERDY